MSADFDTAIIGAGVNGLSAAAFLAKAGRHVIVLEASAAPGGLAQASETEEGFLLPRAVPALHALDPVILKQFRSVRRGLRFAARDLPLVALSGDGRHLVLTRDLHATARSIAAHSPTDAQAWAAYRKTLFNLARAMRRQWWNEGRARLSGPQRALLATLETTSAAAWLDSLFESDLLKAALAFDALDGHASILEPGSALPLLWRAAQEMCGLQGATAVPARGAVQLTRLLAEAARDAGATIRTGAVAARILTDADGVCGVVLASEEVISVRIVLSSLPRRATLLGLAAGSLPFGEARLLAQGAAPTGTASIALALDGVVELGGAALPKTARFIIAERLETLVAAHAAARSGQLPDELPLEAVLTSASDMTVAPPDRHVLSCLVRPVPSGGADWQTLTAKLNAKALATLDRFAPGLVPKVVDIRSFTPRELDEDAATPARMLAPWRNRMLTAIPGLILCGADAEPMAALSGRAGRHAADHVVQFESER